MNRSQRQEEKNLNGRLSYNVLLNLLGRGAPLLVALFAVPILIRNLGTDRYGILAIAWMIIGYFGLFDCGISRALTKLVAEFLAARREQEVDRIVWTAFVLTGILGSIGGATLALLSPWLIDNILRIPKNLRSETLETFYLLASSLPFIVTSANLFGFLEGYQRFDLTNLVRGVMGALTFFAPLLVIHHTCDLFQVTAAMITVRVAGWLSLAAFCVHLRRRLCTGITIEFSHLKRLLKFGGWMTVTSIVGPVMEFFDRFLISMMISVAAVAYYTTSYDLITKLSIFSAAVVGVLFPMMSASFVKDRNCASEVFTRGVGLLFLVLFPVLLLIVSFAQEGLTIWLGSEFADNSTCVLQLLAIGTFLNCLAYVPFALIQGAGRPDLTAKLHLIELPLYLFIVYTLIHSLGIVGAALAWLARVALDTTLLFLIAERFLSNSNQVKRQILPPIFIASLILLVALIVENVYIKFSFAFLFLAIFASVCFLHPVLCSECLAIKNTLKQLSVIHRK